MKLKRHSLVRKLKLMGTALVLCGFLLGLGNLVLAREDVIKVGLIFPLSGPYAEEGADEHRGAELALQQINERGGVLGKEVVGIVHDTQLKAQIALRKVEELIEDEKVKFIIGTLSGGIAAAVNRTCDKAGVIYIAPNFTDITTGEDQSHFTFGKGVTNFMNSVAVGKWVFEYMGDEWYILTSDYRWGHRNLGILVWILDELGGKFLGNTMHPLGTTDFSPYMSKIRAARPEVLIVNNFGGDTVNFVKQARAYGLFDQMKIVCIDAPLTIAKEAGDAMRGAVTGVPWYWELETRYDTAKRFTKAFKDKYDRIPTGYGAETYSAVMELGEAIERAGEPEVEKVIKALEGHEFAHVGSKEYWRPEDHNAVKDFYVVWMTGEGPKGKWDLYEVVAEMKGEEITRTPEQSRVDFPFNLPKYSQWKD